jgi:hypothetical protein
MAPTSLRRLITFALDELSVRNGQYEFEQLCQELVRARIASNIITATGPVNAAGDQGRDAETFETSLHRELGPHSSFLALVSDEPAGFCMTIQKTGLRGKFLEDARKVTSEGATVKKIYALCTARVAVGVRHGHEKALAKKVHIPVTILDGAWITEQLSAPELFWIAERYLDLPADLRPEPSPTDSDPLPGGYDETRTRWQRRAPPPSTRGDFFELRQALRFASEPGPGRPDLPFWLHRISQLLETDDAEMALRVHYELAAAHVLGLRDLTAADDHVRRFLSDVRRDSHPFRLHDAQVLLMFTYGMVRARRTSISAAEWRALHRELTEHLMRLLAADQPPTRRAYLWWTLGMLRIQPKLRDDEVSVEPLEMPEIDVVREYMATHGRPSGAPLFDTAGALEAWMTALDHIGQANLLPLEPLADVSRMFAADLVDLPAWPAFTAKLDRALTLVGGRAAAAAQAFERAASLHDSGRVRQAVLDLNAARIAWLSGDNLRDSADVLLALAECYAELHLLEASQQFALGAVFLARAYDRDDLVDLVPRGLALAGQADFVAGRWVRALRLLLPAMAAESDVRSLTHDFDSEHDGIVAAATQVAAIVRASRDLDANAAAMVEPVFAASLRPLYHAILEAPPQSRLVWEDMFTEHLLGAPFGDARAKQTFRFSALGLDWQISASGADEASSCAAARLASAAEILSVEFAATDLCLIPGTVDLRVRAVQRAPSGEPPDMSGDHIELTSIADPQDSGLLVAEVLAVASMVFLQRSLLPMEQLRPKFAERLAGDLQQRVFAGRDYSELFAAAAHDVPSLPDVEVVPLSETRMMRQHDDLSWQSGPGPTYSEERARVRLGERYAHFPELLRGTLRRLRTDPRFAALAAELRAEGWKDWHILQAVHSAVVTVPDDIESWTEDQVKDYLMRPEPEEVPPIAEGVITRERLEHCRRAGIAATVVPWHLELHTRDFRLDDLERLMAERYNYWIDDIPHDDPFAWS